MNSVYLLESPEEAFVYRSTEAALSGMKNYINGGDCVVTEVIMEDDELESVTVVRRSDPAGVLVRLYKIKFDPREPVVLSKEHQEALQVGTPGAIAELFGCNHLVYINHYKCPYDGAEWTDEWSSMSNDRCPKCGKEIEPTSSDEVVR